MASGSIYGTTSNKYIESAIDWTSSINAVNNTSEVTAKLFYRRTNTGYTTEGTGSFSITINGTKKTASGVKLAIGTAWVLAMTATVTVTHDNDGSKSIAISASGSLPPSSLTSTTCGGTAKLDTIPRASTITSAANVTLGNKCDIRWTPAAASFRYKLKFSLGSWSYTTGAIHPNKTSPYTYSGYEIPLDVAYQILNGYTGSMTVTLYTYSDSGATTQIGSADSETFTVTVPTSLAPIVSMSLSPVHSLPEAFDGIYVQGLSKVKADLSADAEYNADILYYDMTVEGKTYGEDDDYTSGYLTNPGTIAIVGHAVDSRRYGGYDDGSITVLPYANPRIQNVTAKRCDENGNPTDSGTYLKITATRSYHPVISDGKQKNFCGIRYRYKTESASYYSGWVTILDADDLSSDEVVTGPLLDGDLLTTKTYRVEVQAVDDIGNIATSEIIVPTDKVYWHRDGARNALGLGKYNEQDNALDSAWDIHMNGNKVTGLPTPVDDTDAVPLGFLQDYIVEQGTSGIWTYRKWSSGIAECRGIEVRESVALTNAWGSLFESAGYVVDLPVDLFVETPLFSITLVGSRGVMLDVYSEGSKTQTPHISAVRPTSETVEVLNTSIVAYGRWK